MAPDMTMNAKEPVFFSFFVFWVVLGISAFLFFHLNRDARLKKKIYPWFVVGIGIIFASFSAWMSDWQPFVFLVMLPMVALITFLNIRMTKFCESCGRTVYRQPLLGPSKFCPHCGSSLEGRKPDAQQRDLS